MNYHVTYCDNYERVIPMCIIEDRANIPAIKNKPGVDIKAYVDQQLALITDNVLVYRVESADCNLAGFFALRVNRNDKSASKIMEVLRHAFKEISGVSAEINNFIVSGLWRNDILF
jgi:hypothetical protein